MQTNRYCGVFTLLSLAIMACSSKSTSLQARDGANDRDSGNGGASSDPGDSGGAVGTGDGGGGSRSDAQDAEMADASRDTVVVDLGPTDLGLADGMKPGCGVAGDPCVGQTGCSSGDSVDIACRSILVCQNGTLHPANLFFVRCGATSGSACPATQPTEGAACTLAAHTCSYPTGTCTCATGCESGVDAGPCKKPTTWHCDPMPPTGCPVQAPQLGLPCASEKLSCDYGRYCAQYQVSCQSGYWEPFGVMSFGGCA